MVSVCLPSDALLQHLPSYLGFCYLGLGYLFTAAPAKHSRCSLPWTRGISLPPPFMTFNVGWTFVGKVMSLLFNMLCKLIIAFLPSRKHLLISRLQSPSPVILEPPKIVSHCFRCFPIYLPWSDGTRWHVLSFLNAKFEASSFTFIRRLFSSSLFSTIRVVSFAYLRLLIFLWANLIPVCASSSPAFLMMYSAYKLNKQGDNI